MPLDLSDTTIVFDLDGTSSTRRRTSTAATNHALGLVGLAPVTVAELHPFIGHGSKAMIEAGLRFHGASVAEDEAGAAARALPRLLRRQHRRRQPAVRGRAGAARPARRRRRAARGVHQQARGPVQGAARRARPRPRASAPSPGATRSPCASPMPGHLHGHHRDGRRPAPSAPSWSATARSTSPPRRRPACRPSASPSATRRARCASSAPSGVAVIDHFGEFMPALDRCLRLLPVRG